MTGALSTAAATVGTVAGTLFFLWPIGIWYQIRQCEKPKYTVLKTLGQKTSWFRKVPAAEVRLYAPYLVAEVETRGGDMRTAVGAGFRSIAGFIFGKNEAAPGGGEAASIAMTSPVTLEMPSEAEAAAPRSEEVAMTSPVTAEMAGDGTYKVTFIMPSKYTKDTLPRPLNPDVRIKEMPSRTMAALAWNGRSPREPQVEEKKAELLKLLREAGLRPVGSVHVWQYHPPFAPSWQRVNEVLFQLEGGQLEEQPLAAAK